MFESEPENEAREYIKMIGYKALYFKDYFSGYSSEIFKCDKGPLGTLFKC